MEHSKFIEQTPSPAATARLSKVEQAAANRRLLEAAIAADVAGMRQAVANGADINATDAYDNNALFIILKNYLPLYWAVDAIRCAIDLGIDLHFKNKDGWNLLHYAIIQPLMIYMPSWIRHFPSDQLTDNVRCRVLEIIELLVTAGLHPESRTSGGFSAMHLAVDYNSPKIFRKLVELGGNPNSINSSGESVAFLIRRKKLDGDFVGVLEGKKDLHQSALQLSTLHSDFDAVQRAITLPPNDVNYRDDDGCTALYYATQKPNIYIIAFLIQHGADLTIPDNHGNTPTMIALSGCSCSCVIVHDLMIANFSQGNNEEVRKCFNFFYSAPDTFRQLLQNPEPRPDQHQSILFCLNDTLSGVYSSNNDYRSLNFRLALEMLAGDLNQTPPDADQPMPPYQISPERRRALLRTLVLLRSTILAEDEHSAAADKCLSEDAQSMYQRIFNDLLREHIASSNEDAAALAKAELALTYEIIATSVECYLYEDISSGSIYHGLLFNDLMFLYNKRESCPRANELMFYITKTFEARSPVRSELRDELVPLFFLFALASLEVNPSFSWQFLLQFSQQEINQMACWLATLNPQNATREDHEMVTAAVQLRQLPSVQTAILLAQAIQSEDKAVKKSLLERALTIGPVHVFSYLGMLTAIYRGTGEKERKLYQMKHQTMEMIATMLPRIRQEQASRPTESSAAPASVAPSSALFGRPAEVANAPAPPLTPCTAAAISAPK